MTDSKVSIRPEINIAAIPNKSSEEKFQNETLRPILKMQHELIMAFFQNYLTIKKIDLSPLNEERKIEAIYTIFKNDTLLKAELRGLIIGHFTVDEFLIYQNSKAEINKRILAMMKERILSVII